MKQHGFIKLNAIYFNSKSYLCVQENPYELNPFSLKFAFETVSVFVWLTLHGPVSSSRGRLSDTVTLYASLLRVIGGVMSLVLFPREVCQAVCHRFRLSRCKPTSWLLWLSVYLLDGSFLLTLIVHPQESLKVDFEHCYMLHLIPV